MHMYKKWIYLIFSLLLLIHPVTLLADVLIEPEDSFYRTHADECTSERKYYEASTSVSILSSPNDKKGYSTAPSGSVFYISWIYTNKQGNQWGLFDGVEVSYWVKMDDLFPVYSHAEFSVEHASEIMDKDMTFNPDKKGYVCLYEYPGSTWISDILDTEWISPDSFTVHQIYVDEQGHHWGYMPYYMQHNGWINLDDAIVESEPERNVPVIFIPNEKPASPPLIGIIVIAVCTLTGTLYFIIHKRK